MILASRCYLFNQLFAIPSQFSYKNIELHERHNHDYNSFKRLQPRVAMLTLLLSMAKAVSKPVLIIGFV